MRYAVIFDEKNQVSGFLHFVGTKVNPEKETSKLSSLFKLHRFSRQDLMELCGEEWKEKALSLELESDNVIFNQQRYQEQLLSRDEQRKG